MIRSIADATGVINHEDWQLLGKALGSYSRIYKPDMTLAPDGNPYLFRWYLVDEKHRGSVMIHLQVASDPERPLHDHPWDNQSVILSGGYIEYIQTDPPLGEIAREVRTEGDTIVRAGTEAHRLVLPEGCPYALTIFSTGPKLREWGFWYPDGWHHNKRHVADRPNDLSDRGPGRGQVSVHVADKGE